MPTTRRGADAPGKDGLQRQQRSAQRHSTQGNKTDSSGHKVLDTSNEDHSKETVRSTRRSQVVPETTAFTHRRTRGAKGEPVQKEETGRKVGKDVVKPDERQTESVTTRSSKRIAESPRESSVRKQRAVVDFSASEPTETTDTVIIKTFTKTTNDGANKRDVDPEMEKLNSRKGEKSFGKNAGDEQANSITRNDNVKEKTERRHKSAKDAPDTGSVRGTDVISPRRSSRTVVPNSRYKDMVDPGKKKSVIKTEVKKEISAPPPKKPKIDYTAVSVQQLENEITEEIITEEIKIDTLAQMNLIDDMLVLPPTSSGMSVTQSAVSEHETTDTSSTGDKEVKHLTAKVIEYPSDPHGSSGHGLDVLVETSEIHNEFSKEISVDSRASDRDDVTKNKGDLLQSETLPEPQVIVIPSDSGKHVNKIIIPKDPYRARLEQAFEKKGSSMVIGPSTGKAKTKKIIVTPTHQHVSKKEAQRAKMASHAEKIQLKETAFRKELGKPTFTSLIYPQVQKSAISTGQIIHTPEKHVKYTVLPRKEVNSTTTEVDLHCDEETLEMAVDNSNENEKKTASTTSTAMATVPNVKVVYVKAKQKHVSNETKIYKKPLSSHDERSSDTSGIQDLNKADDTSIDNCEVNKLTENEIENTSVADSEDIVKELKVDDEMDLAMGSKPMEVGKLEEVTSVPVEHKIASSLCQVIEYKQQPQTAIEYVLLDNKMVPIHKPYQTGSHGRQHGRQMQTVNRVTPGRVEPETQKGHGFAKKVPLSSTQIALGSVLSQVDDGIDQTPVNQHVKYTISSGQLEVMDMSGKREEVKTEIQPHKVIHGYIDRPVRTGSPTQIVEISSEAFNKEIYGEEISLDVVTGQIVESAVADETSQVERQTVSKQVFEAESQSEHNDSYQPLEETEVNQSVEVAENQSTESDTQTVIVKTDNETTVMYTDNSGDQEENVTSWTPGTSSEHDMLITDSTREGQVSAEDGLVRIADSLYNSQIPENATITVEKLASGGEIVIMQIKEAAVSETLQKIKTLEPEDAGSSSAITVRKSPVVVKARAMEKPAPQFKKDASRMKILPVQKLSGVKITPVRAYEKSESHSRDIGESSSGIVSKTTGTNTESSDVEFTEMDEEEEEAGIKVEKSSLNKGNPYQEYIVVRLPEGTEIKQLQARQRKEIKPLGEEVTVNNEGLYVCVDCGHKTENRGNWFKHRRKHLGIRPHACTRCSYRAATSSNLKRHMQIHDDVRNFHCAYCNTLFRQKIHLERHLKYKHEEKNVQCPLCDYVCSSENPDLKIHIKRRHMPHEGALNAFTCDVCGLMTVSKKDLKQHKKFHKNGPELKLFCEHCSFVTDCVSRLRRHMLIHTKERPFQCGLCTYRATQKEHVLRHMRSQHGVEVERNQRRSLLEKNYHNPQEFLVAGIDQSSSSSNKEASSEADLGPFEKSDYSSTDKIFACNYCSMKFAKLINLYKHLYAQHKQVMPDEGPNDFQCVVCDFRTNNKKNLLVHMRKHNMQDHSPPTHVYSCVLCRYINPRRRNLFQHMKKKHGIEIIMKDDGLNCYVTLDNAAAQVQGQNVKSSVMALSDIVTTQTMDDATQSLFIAESSDDSSTFHAEKITIDNIIPDDIESYVVSDSSQEHGIVSPQVSVTTVPHASVQEHEAAEAIEGLQALAEQAGILETQNIDNDMTTGIVSSAIEIASTEIMNDGEVLNTSEAIAGTETVPEEQSGQAAEGFELSTEQLNQLATGDYVEINGEVYKVEIAPEPS